MKKRINDLLNIVMNLSIFNGKIYLMLLLTISFESVYSQNTPVTPAPRTSTRHFLRAPDVMPGTLPEMREASYWISKMSDPDQVVLTISRIQAMNSSFQKRLENPLALDSTLYKLIVRKVETSPGLIIGYPNLYSKTPEALSTITAGIVKKQIDYLKRGKYGNALAIEYSEKEISGFEQEMAYSQIADKVIIQPGIVVEDVQLRIIPFISPAMVGLSDKNRTKWDLWNLDIVPIGSSVQILHTSKSGGSVFVLSENGYGWISSQKVALGTKAQTEQFNDLSSFIVCTGDRVPFYSDSTSKYVSGWLRMGDRLPLSVNNPRIVNVPVRQTNGNLVIQQAWLSSNADVHMGYLPYTRKNVVELSLKLQDNIYDWTGAWLGRNHATALRDIFACFGFKLPSYGELMAVYNNKVERLLLTETKEKKYQTLLAHDPFLTIPISSSGHSLLLLGDHNGVPIVYDTHGYGYTDDQGRELDIRRSNVGSIELPDYFLKQDIAFVILK